MIYDMPDLKEKICKIYTPSIESSFELLMRTRTDSLYDVYIGDSDSKIRHFGLQVDPSADLIEYKSSMAVGEAIKVL